MEKENNFKYKFEKEEYLKGREHVLKLENFKRNMTISSDQFVISEGNLKNIIAGYPWFLDWMRDTMISFEGLLLKTRRYDDAKKVIENIVDKTLISKEYIRKILERIIEDQKQGYKTKDYPINAEKQLKEIKKIDFKIKV